MNETLLFIAAITILSLIIVLPMALMLFHAKKLRLLNRLANINQARAIADARNGLLGRLRPRISPAVPVINTRTTTIWTAVFISLITLLALTAFYCTHQIIADKIQPIEVQWVKADTLDLKSGPTWFFYDSKIGRLKSAHSINETEKTQLSGLLNTNDRLYKSYSRAVDELAYRSNLQHTDPLYCWLTLLYAVAGLIGVQLRTINNFIGVACFKNDFKFHIWWPWYLARPLLGFITGAAVFLLKDGKQLLAGQLSGGINSVALVVAFLGGFSTDEFYELLRKLSKRIFGA